MTNPGRLDIPIGIHVPNLRRYDSALQAPTSIVSNLTVHEVRYDWISTGYMIVVDGLKSVATKDDVGPLDFLGRRVVLVPIGCADRSGAM